MNPTLRGFLIILAIVAVAIIVVLQLEATLAALLILARIAFLLAIAFFVYSRSGASGGRRDRAGSRCAGDVGSLSSLSGDGAAVADIGAGHLRRRARTAGARVSSVGARSLRRFCALANSGGDQHTYS